MESTTKTQTEAERLKAFSVDALFRLFCKCVALVFIGFAIFHWMNVVGFSNNDVRIDTISNDRKIGLAFLAIIQPVAALGLWSGLTWGLVVWAMAAAGEVLMYIAFPDRFGQFDSVLLFHAGCAAALFIYFLIKAFESKRGSFTGT